MRFFQDEDPAALTGERPLGQALSVRLLTRAVAFADHPVSDPSLSDGDPDDPASFSSVTTFDTEGEDVSLYDPTGRVDSPDERSRAASAMEPTEEEEAESTEAIAADDTEARSGEAGSTRASPAAARGAAPEDGPEDVGGAAAPSVRERDDDEDFSDDERQRIAAAEDDDDFLRRLKAITGAGEAGQGAASPEEDADQPPKPPPPTAVAQGRHGVFDELAPLLHRAQTFDLGTHRVDRARLDALAASVWAEEAGADHGTRGREAVAAPIESPGTEHDDEVAPGPELDLDGEELRQALAGVAPAKREQASLETPAAAGQAPSQKASEATPGSPPPQDPDETTKSEADVDEGSGAADSAAAAPEGDVEEVSE